jgi:hypothetical protein
MAPDSAKDQPTRIRGPAGSGFVYAPTPQVPDQTATLRAWVLTCPGQSPAWSQFLLSVVHLRPIEGARPVTLHFPGAGHEFLLLALDPQRPVHGNEDLARHLTPVNVSVQEAGLTDGQAVAICDGLAAMVVSGQLPAEPALSGGAQELYKRVIRASAQHLFDGLRA